MAYINLATLKSYLDINVATWDDLLNLINEASARIIERYCKRKFEVREIKEKKYIQWQDRIRLKEYPVGATYSFYLNDNLLKEEEFDLNKEEGIFYFLGPNGYEKKSGKFEAQYYAGMEPDDLVRETNLQLASMYWRKRRSEGLSSERIGDYSYAMREEAFREILRNLETYVKDVI